MDLLVTAAEQWGVLTTTGPPSAEGDRDVVSVASTQSAGLALIHALTEANAGHPSGFAGYRFEAVRSLDPVEVLKAAHALVAAACRGTGRRGSVAQRITAGVERAAAERIDGYQAAPWVWTRPVTRTGPALGLGGGWRPELPGLEWLVEPGRLHDRWESASLVVLTLAGVADLPVMPHRAGVFVIAERSPDDATWSEIVALAPEAVLRWPGNLTWLLEQLRAPSPQFSQYRTG